MKTICIVFLIITCPFFIPFNGNYRTVEPILVTGRVTIWNDIPLENIKITSSKSKKETFSDSHGEFSIEVGNKDKLKFSAEGFTSQKVKIKNPDNKINVEMKLLSEDFSEEDLMVNNGFRYIPQAHRTTAIQRLKEKKENEFASYNSVWDIIRGKISGVIIQNNEAYFREGLSGSVNTTSTPAIIILNGSRTNSSTITNMDTHLVKDVTLLKGGAASIYGGAGGAGVIVITTK